MARAGGREAELPVAVGDEVESRHGDAGDHRPDPLVMHLGAEAVFVGSGIFKSEDPEARARAIVKATTYYQDPQKVLEASEGLGLAMVGLEISKLPEGELMQTRGW